MDAVEIAEHPLFYGLRFDVVDAEPRPQDRVGDQALGEGRDRWSRRVVVRAGEASPVARSYLADFEDRARAAGAEEP